MALLSKLKAKLSKTRQGILGRLQKTLSVRSGIDEELLEEVEELLISSDVGIDTTLAIIDGVRKRVKVENLDKPDVIQALLCEEMKSLLNGNHERSDFFSIDRKPFVIMVVGVNGTGKTTTIGKLAAKFTDNGKKVLISASDTFRAAASEQLEIWAKRSGSHIVRHQEGADPAAVAFDTVNAALARNMDVVIIDTAGRLHTKINLMNELVKVNRVLGRQVPDAPHETLLILDATTGQNARRQVEEFGRALNLTGIVLTKLDGTAKGGVVIGIANDYKVPIKFIGVGEQLDDLVLFDADSFVDAIFAS